MDMKKIDEALRIDLLYRLAGLHWQEWGKKLGINPDEINFPSNRTRGENFVRTWASKKGIPEDAVLFPMEQRLMHFGLLDQKLSQTQRLILSERADSVRIETTSSLNKYKILPSPLENLQIQDKKYYAYFTPDGKSIRGEIVYFQDSEGNSTILPLTLWKYNNNNNTYWDWLSWETPLPLYRVDQLFKYPSQNTVFIAPSEMEADWIVKCSILGSLIPIITWAGGLSETLQITDWSLLESRRIAIVVQPSEEGVKLANSLFLKLEKVKAKNISFILPEVQLNVVDKEENLKKLAIIHDISHVILNKALQTRNTFFNFAEQEFGLKLSEKKNRALSLGEFLTLQTSKVTWLIHDLLRMGDRVMIYGAPKSGKTTWIVHEALNMAKNGHSVFYIDGEMSVNDFQSRLNNELAGDKYPAKFNILSSCVLEEDLNLEIPKAQSNIIQQTKNAEIVIFDNLNALFPSSLQSGPEGCETLDNLVNVLHRKGKTVIIIHHSSRSGASFGSSVKELGLELKLKVTRKGQEITITPEEARGLSPEQKTPRRFTIPSAIAALDQNESTPPEVPSAVTEEKGDIEQAVRHELEKNPKISCRDLSSALNINKSKAAQLIKKIKNEANGGVSEPAEES